MHYKLTEFSHGAGCGCKLSPGVLTNILGDQSLELKQFDQLLVGNDTKDDAAVVDLDGETAIVSTTDFFMPIVDDPFDFGAIAATNAISDIYAMGAEPLMAIAILGWPIDKIPAEVAGAVLKGGREICKQAGIPLAGGHSIDAPEPIFGLAVTGKVAVKHIKHNKTGKEGDILYLTKPLGIGAVATAQKQKIVDFEDLEIAKKSMMTLNKVGKELGYLNYVHALTDVTGFGLGGHLLEICEAAELGAEVYFDQLPVFDLVDGDMGGVWDMSVELIEYGKTTSGSDREIMLHEYTYSGQSHTYNESNTGTVYGVYIKVGMWDDLINYGPYNYEVKFKILRQN